MKELENNKPSDEQEWHPIIKENFDTETGLSKNTAYIQEKAEEENAIRIEKKHLHLSDREANVEADVKIREGVDKSQEEVGKQLEALSAKARKTLGAKPVQSPEGQFLDDYLDAGEEAVFTDPYTHEKQKCMVIYKSGKGARSISVRLYNNDGALDEKDLITPIENVLSKRLLDKHPGSWKEWEIY